MCGLVGLMGVAAPDLGRLLGSMNEQIAHRGPDSQGRWTDPERLIGLGHRRLAVIDLSSTGHQPMASRDERWVLVLNGEIYDHAEHRARLEQTGVRFRGSSDTEVLLELIARHGVQTALQQIDGMFALAVWDRAQEELWLARDRLGEKPLYYGEHGGRLCFASELHALRALPWIPNDPDPTAVAEFVRLGYVPSPLSIIPGVRKLPAGRYLHVRGGAVGEPSAYWSLDDVVADGRSQLLAGSDAELTTALDQALRASVRRRLVADVPLGVFLSGGLDSSTVAAIAQDVSPRTVRTFTVAVGGEIDESAAAEGVASHLGTDHTTIPLPDVDPVSVSSRIATHYDEPFADPSAIPTLLLCQAAREHVTVCLSGDGADELLAGYNRHKVAVGRLSQILTLPRPIRGAAARVLQTVPTSAWDNIGRGLRVNTTAVGTKVHKLAAALSASDVVDAYGALSTQWSPSSVLSQSVLLAVQPTATTSDMDGRHGLLSAVLHHEQGGMLPDNMLVKTDRASMSVALEIRVPFLDHRVVEMTWRLPDHAKVRAGEGKWVERQVLQRYVPRELWDRPKTGFDPPLAEWLRGPLREWARDLLSPDRLVRQGLLRPEPVNAALTAHLDGRVNRDYALWTVLMLQAHLESVEQGAVTRCE